MFSKNLQTRLTHSLFCVAIIGIVSGTAFGQAPAIMRIVTIQPAEKGLQRVVEQPAQVEAYAIAPLYAKIGGYVDKVPIEIGQVVKEGTVLLTISSPELVADFKQKESLVKQADAALDQAQAAIDVAAAMEKTAAAQTEELAALVAKAKAELTRTKSELDRMTQLVATNSVPTKVRDEALGHFQAAEANVSAAEAKAKTGTALIDEAKAKAASAQADKRAAEAKQAVAAADLALAKAMLAYTEVRAPFDGAIAQRAVDPGHLVSAASANSGKPLLTIVQTDRLRVAVDVPESESGFLTPGDPLTIRFPALGNLSVTDKVTRVAAALDTNTRTLRAEIELPNTEGKLKPGLFAHALITVAEREKCLVLPVSAVATDAGKSYCLGIQGGVIAKIPVELGLRAGNEVEIVQGIKKTDQIIPKNLSNYTVGQPAEAILPAAK